MMLICCNLLQCVAVCCSDRSSNNTVCCSVLQRCVAVCCSVAEIYCAKQCTADIFAEILLSGKIFLLGDRTVARFVADLCWEGGIELRVADGLFSRDIGLFCRDVGLFRREFGLFCGDIGLFC